MSNSPIFALQEGDKPVNLRELTDVSDRSEQAQSTHLQREKRRVYIGLPQWSHPKWVRLGITSLEEYARHFNCV